MPVSRLTPDALRAEAGKIDDALKDQREAFTAIENTANDLAAGALTGQTGPAIMRKVAETRAQSDQQIADAEEKSALIKDQANVSEQNEGDNVSAVNALGV